MRPTIILAFGDSVTAGKCDEHGGGWPARLARNASRTLPHSMFYNLGVNGETAADIAGRWEEERARRVPVGISSIQLFAFGLNDCSVEEDGTQRLELIESINQATRMIVASKSFGPTLWIGPTPIDEALQPRRAATGELRAKKNCLVARYNEAYKACALGLCVPYLDLYSSLYASTDWQGQLSDGVHPTASGYDILAFEIGKWNAWKEAVTKID